jgi:hypothetical protein
MALSSVRASHHHSLLHPATPNHSFPHLAGPSRRPHNATDMSTDTPLNRALDRVGAILLRCGTQGGVMPPTELYNEGWMLRLVLSWFFEHPGLDHPLGFVEGSTWYSEALLESRFLARKRGDSLAEGYTNADAVIGNVTLRDGGRGDIRLLPGARQFVITEAKLGSGLSAGTRNVQNYNQAARNVACMAHLLETAGRAPETVAKLGFYVIAPASRIREGFFGAAMERSSIQQAVAERVGCFGSQHGSWYDGWFCRVVEAADIAVMSWEAIVDYIGSHDQSYGLAVGEFYERCRRFNRLAPGGSGVRAMRSTGQA